MDDYLLPNDDPWFLDPLNRGLDVLGAWASKSPYYSPDDPRYQRYPQTQTQTQPQPYPQPGAPRPSGESGINISTNMAMLVVGGVLLFMLGRRK